MLSQIACKAFVRHGVRSLHTSLINRSKTSNSPIFANQSKLPRIPVPELRATLDGYLTSLKPIISEEQFQRTVQICKDYERKEEWGPSLHKQVLALDKASPTSYIEGFWTTMYLEYREPSSLNVNPAMILAKQDIDVKSLASKLHSTEQIATAACMLHSSAKYIKLIRSGELKPDVEKTVALDMSQHPKLFGATRIPGYSRDKIVYHLEKNPKHVIILCRSLVFKVDILDADDEPIPVNEIAAQLSLIEQHTCSSSDPTLPIGPFTSMFRLNWSLAYGTLSGLGNNRQTLDIMESALLALCLETDPVRTTHETNVSKGSHPEYESPVLLKDVLIGNPENRHFDKSIQLIIYQNGTTGLNFEHTSFDGHTIMGYANSIQADKIDINSIQEYSKKSEIKLHPLVLQSNDELESIKEQAFKDISSKWNQVAVQYVFPSYGKKFITSKGFSPDAFVQLVFQLAYYRLHNKLASTYESSNVKHYFHGRTECIRSASNEALTFAQMFDDPTKSDSDKIAAMKAAFKRHVDQMNMSKDGKLPDRHLQVMKWLAIQQHQREAEYQIPPLFTDPSFGEYFSNVLSTSNCGGAGTNFFGFGAALNDGHGLGYMIKDDCVPVSVTSSYHINHQYHESLTKAFEDMKTFLEKSSSL